MCPYICIPKTRNLEKKGTANKKKYIFPSKSSYRYSSTINTILHFIRSTIRTWSMHILSLLAIFRSSSLSLFAHPFGSIPVAWFCVDQSVAHWPICRSASKSPRFTIEISRPIDEHRCWLPRFLLFFYSPLPLSDKYLRGCITFCKNFSHEKVLDFLFGIGSISGNFFFFFRNIEFTFDYAWKQVFFAKIKWKGKYENFEGMW